MGIYDKNDYLNITINMYKFKGGVIHVDISWECDYDWGGLCMPDYTFKRFDLPFKSNSSASGFNFR